MGDLGTCALSGVMREGWMDGSAVGVPWSVSRAEG